MQMFPPDAQIKPGMRVKFGIDPTLDRLHLGHFVPLRLARRFQEEGHPLAIILGTFTAQLGDPSGRDTTRPMLDREAVELNANRILEQLSRILMPGFDVLRNGDLFNKMTVPEFMRLAAQFTTTHMLSRDAFQLRLENSQTIALHELLVPICQGWDSVALKAEIEIGGQDQLFNFQIARQLQETQGQPPQICLMMPIICGTDGRKMSKSFGNCIFLDEHPNDIFGKIMSISDEVMGEWFPLFTHELQLDHPMESKKLLATEIVQRLCGEVASKQAKDHFESTIQQKQFPVEITNIQAANIVEAVSLIKNCSRTEARRLLEGGGVSVDSVKVGIDFPIELGMIIKVGKRFFGKVWDDFK